MPLSSTLDIDTLLAPIPGENPAGESLLYAETYGAIKEARRADDELNQGEWKHDLKTSDWSAVIEIASAALATKSKDLQITVWLTEALVKQRGFPGLRDGLRLLRGLQERLWEPLYPEIENGDLEARALVLEFLNRTLPLPIRQVPLTQGEGYSWLRWQESRDVDNLGLKNPEAQQAALDEGKISGELFDKAVAASPRAYYEILFADLNQSWEEYQQLDRVVDEKFGREVPGLLDVKKAIEDCRALVEGIVKKKRELEPDPTPAESESAAAEDGSPAELANGGQLPTTVRPERRVMPSLSRPGSVPLEPQDRADALRRLAAVAEYFRKTEPHSPVAYLVERAVRWGQMPLEQWLQALIKDENVLAQVQETLGLKDSGESN